MRSLYFRAWDDEKKIMLDGDFIEDNHPTYTSGLSYGKLFIANHADGEWYDCIVMQSTGLYDKNGRQIFEGDIVKAASAGQYAICEIKWGVGPAKFFLYSKIGGISWNLSGPQESIEVIGNIYENPELLGKQPESV